MAALFMDHYPKTAKAIRAFSGPANARLRRMIRQALEANIDVRTLTRMVALTAQGVAKLEAVAQAWEEENPIVGR